MTNTNLKGRTFNGKYYLKFKLTGTSQRKRIRQKLRADLALSMETFIEMLPLNQPISKRNTGHNPPF